VWIAAAMTEGDREVFSERGHVTLGTGEPGRIDVSYMVFDEALYRLYYDVVSSSLLWFALHEIFDVTRRPVIDSRLFEAWEKSYTVVNKAFARACEEFLLRQDPTRPAAVLIQDYHLFLTAKFLGRRTPTQKVIFFMHTAFPTPEGLTVLPAAWVREILEGMLAADIVGFQSGRWAANFVSACKTFLGADVIADEYPGSSEEDLFTVYYRDTKAGVGIFPLGPDVDSLVQAAEAESVAGFEKELELAEDDFVVVSVERVDPAKNSLRSLRAIDELLESYPELRGKLKYLLFMYPSRERLIEYRAYESECASLARAINAKWGQRGYEPITFDLSDSYERSLAALRRYDALLVNSLADGMNLVAREGPIVNRRDGLVVLSSRTGAADLYGDLGLSINPFDISEQAAAIAEVWQIPRDVRKQRASKLAEVAGSHTPQSWLRDQIEAAFDFSPY
jgi:trehalose 6-phosphate synthase